MAVSKQGVSRLLRRAGSYWEYFGGDKDPATLVELLYEDIPDAVSDDDLEAAWAILLSRNQRDEKATGRTRPPGLFDVLTACQEAARRRLRYLAERKAHYEALYYRTKESRDLVEAALAEGMTGGWTDRLQAHKDEWVTQHLLEEGLLR